MEIILKKILIISNNVKDVGNILLFNYDNIIIKEKKKRGNNHINWEDLVKG